VGGHLVEVDRRLDLVVRIEREEDSEWMRNGQGGEDGAEETNEFLIACEGLGVGLSKGQKEEFRSVTYKARERMVEIDKRSCR
jgi:hypothetical protein